MSRNVVSAGLKSREINLWHEITLICVIFMEISWVVPWFKALTPSTTNMSSILVLVNFGLAIWLSNILMRTMNSLRIRDKYLKLFITGFGIIYIFVSIRFLLRGSISPNLSNLFNQSIDSISDVGKLIPPEFLIAISCLFLIYWGIILAREWSGRDTVFGAFKRGIIMFIAYTLVVTTFTGETLELLPYVFLTASLFGMVTSRIEVLLTSKTRTRNPFDSGWISGITATIIAILVISMGAALLIAGQISRIFQFVKIFFYAIVIILLAPILLLLGLMEPTLEVVRNAIPTSTTVPTVASPEITNPNIDQITSISDNALRFGSLFRSLMIVFIVLLISFFVISSINHWRVQTQNKSKEDKENIFDSVSILKLLLDGIRNRIKETAGELSFPSKLRLQERMLAATRIRKIYTSLMDMCEELGYPRPIAATPLEFLPSLGKLFPDHYKELRNITNSYMSVRYGELPETQHEVEEVENAWIVIKKQGKALKTRIKNENPSERKLRM